MAPGTPRVRTIQAGVRLHHCPALEVCTHVSAYLQETFHICFVIVQKRLLAFLLSINHSITSLYYFALAVYTDPWISCPIDRVEELEPDKSTVVLGYKWQLPRTNMKNVTVSPSNYDENYPFPVGRHRVTWIGTSDRGTQKSCSFHITVSGKHNGRKHGTTVGTATKLYF